jgi:hypothetical protein
VAWLVEGNQWQAAGVTVPVEVGSPRQAAGSVLVGSVPVELEREELAGLESAGAGSRQGAGPVGPVVVAVVVAVVGFPQS